MIKLQNQKDPKLTRLRKHQKVGGDKETSRFMLDPKEKSEEI